MLLGSAPKPEALLRQRTQAVGYTFSVNLSVGMVLTKAYGNLIAAFSS